MCFTEGEELVRPSLRWGCCCWNFSQQMSKSWDINSATHLDNIAPTYKTFWAIFWCLWDICKCCHCCKITEPRGFVCVKVTWPCNGAALMSASPSMWALCRPISAWKWLNKVDLLSRKLDKNIFDKIRPRISVLEGCLLNLKHKSKQWSDAGFDKKEFNNCSSCTANKSISTFQSNSGGCQH
jgi:hypothetical protein